MSLKIRINPSRVIDKVKSVFRQLNMEVSANHQMSDDYTELYGRLPLKVHLAYGIGHVLNDVCASMWFTYLLVFFHLVLGFDNQQTGLLLLVGQIADALATPFVGYHSDQSDNFWFCGYGKRKTWHLFGTICVLGAFPFIFSSCVGCSDSNKSAQMFYFCMFIIIFQFGWAAVQISHLSLIPELTPNEHDRTKLTAIRYCFTVISNVLVYVITWITLHINSAENPQTPIGPGDEKKFEHVVWSVLSVGAICSLLFHILVKETSNEGTNNVRAGQLRTSVRDLLTDFKVYQVAFIYMTSRLFVNLTQVFIPLYLHETLEMNASSLALVPLVMYIGSFVTSMCLERINRCCGRKITYSIGAALAIAACVWIKFGEKGDYSGYYIYVVALLLGSGGSIILVSSLGVTTDLIGEKTDSGAFVYGIMSFTDKLANGIAVVIIQDLHTDDKDKNFYREILTNVCGISALLGTIAVICLFTRTRARNLNYENVPNYNSIN